MVPTDFPRRVLVYAFEYADGEPLLAVSSSVDDIPEDETGNLVGIYELKEVRSFVITKTVELI